MVSKKNKICLYTLIFLVFCVVFAKTFVSQLNEKSRLNAKIHSLEEQKDKLNNEISEIKDNIQKVDSEEFVKKVAREKLKMIEKDEIIVKYKDSE